VWEVPKSIPSRNPAVALAMAASVGVDPPLRCYRSRALP
jgi:hypothetical protein